MKTIGITRVRNEALVIQNTLDWVADMVDEIHVFDDASEDSTPDICEAHPWVAKVFRNTEWLTTGAGRILAEKTYRQQLYRSAVAAGADYVYVFDADEYIEPDFSFDLMVDAYYFTLFDFYITTEDVDADYWERKWMGPEYRNIPMIFRVSSELDFTQRVPRGIGPNVKFGGYCKHYGKAMSVEQWDLDCEYYANVRWNNGRQPRLKLRWLDRIGKAIHTESDFGRQLITWEDRKDINKIMKMPI